MITLRVRVTLRVGDREGDRIPPWLHYPCIVIVTSATPLVGSQVRIRGRVRVRV